MRFASNSYFFFFLAVFLDFFFFAFFAMFPSVIPKVGSMHIDNSTCMHSDYTTIVKLILRASKKVNGMTSAKALGLKRAGNFADASRSDDRMIVVPARHTSIQY